MHNILVTGADGQLGSEIRTLASNYNNFNFIFTDVNNLDITNINDVEEFFTSHPIDYTINCAAYTAVDKAETNQETANSINVTGVKNLVALSQKYSSKLIHISTDYVFDGNNHKPYVETDITNPVSVYGKTKLEAEQIILNSTIKSIIIRTSWLYSSYGNNFVKTMMRLGSERDELNVIFDQVGTPTYAFDLAKTILEIIVLSAKDNNNFKQGIYHFSNQGVCSWYDFAIEIMKFSNINCKINPIESKDYPTPAKRPFYSVLNKSKIENTFNISIPYWKNSLSQCVKKLSVHSSI
ncbi:MAG: dTDP-4-dehydrorhamnose reductase [Bacteroidetes bacterium]|nr:MAG: dTDP-4-dehydrorhamnose reductase [Bacteroidota bacterium]